MEDGGPPPWVPFGRKVQQIPQIDLKAKEEEKEKEKEREEKDEDFLNQRQDAINAAVNTSGTIKIVKGSGRQVKSLYQTLIDSYCLSSSTKLMVEPFRLGLEIILRFTCF